MLQHLLAVFQQLVQGLLLMLQTIQCLKCQLSTDALDSVVIPARSMVLAGVPASVMALQSMPPDAKQQVLRSSPQGKRR